MTEIVVVPAGFRLEQGRARVNVIDVHHDTPDFLAVEIDMHSKYIEPIIASGSDQPSEIHFWPGDRGIHLDMSTDKITMLMLPARTAGWEVIASGGRYTIQIAAWRRKDAEPACDCVGLVHRDTCVNWVLPL